MSYSPGQPTPRDIARRRRHRDALRQGHPPCGICGEPIDYSAPYLDPREYVVDHIVPLIAGGSDELSNKQPAHRECNTRKGKRLDGGPTLRRSASLS